MSLSKAAYRLVVVGKTGSGKSTVCNKLLGRDDDLFPVYNGMIDPGKTDSIQMETNERLNMQVIDTPDVFNMGYNESKAKKKFREWEAVGSSAATTAVLIVVRLDIPFNPFDQQLYASYYRMLPWKYRNNIILVFTHADEVRKQVSEEIQHPSLTNLLKRAHGRFIDTLILTSGSESLLGFLRDIAQQNPCSSISRTVFFVLENAWVDMNRMRFVAICLGSAMFYFLFRIPSMIDFAREILESKNNRRDDDRREKQLSGS